MYGNGLRNHFRGFGQCVSFDFQVGAETEDSQDYADQA